MRRSRIRRTASLLREMSEQSLVVASTQEHSNQPAGRGQQQRATRRSNSKVSGEFLGLQRGHILAELSLLFLSKGIMSDPKNNRDPADPNPNLPFNVRLSYSPDPAEKEAYLAYQECMIEMEERDTAKNPKNGQDVGFVSSSLKFDKLNFKTPSPNTYESAFAPITQPPVMRGISLYSSFGSAESRGTAVAPGQMHAIFNPYANASGRRSAPPMLPSPPSDNSNLNNAPTAHL
jgi:hypothetical protein